MGNKDIDALREFIEGLTDRQIVTYAETGRTICRDVNFRLDMQGKTTDGRHNLQVQANKGAKLRTVAKHAPDTVAGPVLVSSTMTPADIRAELLKTMRFEKKK